MVRMESSKPDTTNVDISSILEKVKSLEAEKTAMQNQLTESKQRVEKLVEGKKNEMNSTLNNVIKKYLDKIEPQDESRKETMTVKKDQFMKGLQSLADNTQEDSGIWQVMVCASEMEELRASEMEKLRTEVESLRASAVGKFAEEETRVGSKRRAESEPAVAESKDLWDDFNMMLRAENSLPVPEKKE